MLEVRDLHAGYGRIPVLRGVSLSVPPKHIVGLLGANGAGKTTLIRAISGLAAVHSGDIRFHGATVIGARPEMLVRRGLVQVPQGRLLFGEMSVRENLEMGAYAVRSGSAFEAALERVHAMFPVLRERGRQSAMVLSGGEQQMLALGRALMSNPRCLLLDEPSLGLAPKALDTILAAVERIRAAGTPVLIADQNARKVLQLAQYCYVLENGRIALEGDSRRLSSHPGVVASYLGATGL
jgi:branched-chain amino acid transport system ATP-binding protein